MKYIEISWTAARLLFLMTAEGGQAGWLQTIASLCSTNCILAKHFNSSVLTVQETLTKKNIT